LQKKKFKTLFKNSSEVGKLAQKEKEKNLRTSIYLPGVESQICNHGTCDSEAGGLKVYNQVGLYSETLS
jgi:hypothetical protein